MSPARDTVSLWQQCASCAYARAGGPPCYYHNSKFGIGKLTTIMHDVVEEFTATLNEVADELGGALDDELKELP